MDTRANLFHEVQLWKVIVSNASTNNAKNKLYIKLKHLSSRQYLAGVDNKCVYLSKDKEDSTTNWEAIVTMNADGDTERGVFMLKHLDTDRGLDAPGSDSKTVYAGKRPSDHNNNYMKFKFIATHPAAENHNSDGVGVIPCLIGDEPLTGLLFSKEKTDTMGYKLIPIDLTKGTGGDNNVFLYIRRDSNGPFIEEIAILYGKDASIPPGFKKLDQDLNEGAGGYFVYLCYKAGNRKEKAIKDVIIRTSSSAEQPIPPYYDGVPYKKLPYDLNHRSGGDYIYIYYRK